MYIKSKKIKLMLIVILLLIICIVIGVLKHREDTFATRTINGRVDIGGYSLNVNCYGKGTPTVIFESGLGYTNSTWSLVQPEISKIARTFSYDRAGLGNSDISKLPRTSLDQVHELHTLLTNAKVKGPYIIVAHSIGGFNARLFAGTYPNEVSGIVFVDSTHEYQFDGFSGTYLEELNRNLDSAEPKFDGIQSAKQVEEIRKKDALRNIPIVVLTSTQPAIFQDDLSKLSKNSKHILVKDSGHFIQNDKPQVVIDSIKELIDSVRK